MNPTAVASTTSSEGEAKVSRAEMAGITNHALTVLDRRRTVTADELEAALRRSSRMELLPLAAEPLSQPTNVITADEIKSPGSSPIAEEVENVLRSIYTQSTDSSPEESAREMRFAIRLIVISWVDCISHGATARIVFCEEALHAVDANHTGLINIRSMAARSIGSILMKAEWDMNWKAEDGAYLPDNQQPANQAIHQVIEGMKRINAEINVLLEEHGSVGIEFDDPDALADEEETKNPAGDQDKITAESRPTPPFTTTSHVTPLLTPQRGSTTTLVGKKLKWTIEENEVLLQIWKDMPNATKEAIGVEHNKRMKASREAAGSTVHYARSAGALRDHLKGILKSRGLA